MSTTRNRRYLAADTEIDPSDAHRAGLTLAEMSHGDRDALRQALQACGLMGYRAVERDAFTRAPRYKADR